MAEKDKVVDKEVTEPTEEQKELMEAVIGKIKELVPELTKDGVKQEDIDKKLKPINDQIKELNDKSVKELKDQFDELSDKYAVLEAASKEQGTEMEKMKIGEQKEQPMNFEKAIRQAILDKSDIFLKKVNDDNGERLSMKEYFEDGNKVSPKFEVNKVAVDMLQSNIVGNYVATLRLSQLDPNRVGIPLTIYPHALDVIPQRPLNKPYMSLLVVGTYTDGVATKTEGSASGKSSFLLTTQSFTCFNIATHFPISEETLDDLDEVLAEIAQVAPDKINQAVDTKIFRDDGDGTTDIQGLFVGGTTCTDFVASDYSETVPGANLIDLIDKMKLAVELADYEPDTVGLNAVDISRFRGLKDQLDNSIMDRRVVFNNMGDVVSICGLAVIKNNKITANSCYVGSSKQYQIGVRKGLTMEIGLNSDDFIDMRKTVRFSIRLAFGVRDKAAFQYCDDMTSDKDTIKETPAA